MIIMNNDTTKKKEFASKPRSFVVILSLVEFIIEQYINTLILHNLVTLDYMYFKAFHELFICIGYSIYRLCFWEYTED